MKSNVRFRESHEKAVSTVIGVILMVAITVAIASMMYIYVNGMIGQTKDQTANIACIADSAKDRITITTTTESINWSDVVIVTDNTTVNWRVYNFSSIPLDVVKSTSGATADINSGDYIEFDFAAHPGMSGNVYVSMRFTPTNSLLGSWTITV